MPAKQLIYRDDARDKIRRGMTALAGSVAVDVCRAGREGGDQVPGAQTAAMNKPLRKHPQVLRSVNPRPVRLRDDRINANVGVPT
jgi:hypothetical protein